jgi:hypothetical protein
MILRDNIEYIFKTKKHEIYGKFTSTEYKREIVERERERERIWHKEWEIP